MTQTPGGSQPPQDDRGEQPTTQLPTNEQPTSELPTVAEHR